MNYNMNNFDMPLSELVSMLRSTEQNLSKGSLVLTIQRFKGNGKGKVKGKRHGLHPSKRQKVARNDPCFHCGEFGHWRQNCKVFLEEARRKKKRGETSTSGIYVIEVNVSTASTSWVLDTGCDAHICGNVQALKSSRTLAKGRTRPMHGKWSKSCCISHRSL